MIQTGLTSKLCSYVHGDVEEVSLEILENSLRVLFNLLPDSEAWEVIYESNILLPILSFLSYDNPRIVSLWYEGVKELGQY